MNHLFELLRERSYKRTSLSVQQNNPTVRFYKRLGYIITDEKLDHAGHEDYIMVKYLGISLRELAISDAAELSAIVNNKNVWDNMDDIPYPNTPKDSEDFIRLLIAEKEQKIAFAICYDGKIIGWIGVFRRENIRRMTGEMGYYIAEEYWGKGITTEAIKQMCKYIFENTDIVRIFAEAFGFNKASCRVLEKAGFVFEGVLRKNGIKNGQIIDMKLYAIIKPKAKSHEYILETERLILRELTACDMPALREIVQDEQTMYAWGGAWSEDETVDGLEKQLCAYKEDGFGRWAVVLKETNTVIGVCGLLWCDTDKDKVLEIGYLLNRAYWHHGYACEAAVACKNYTFDNLEYDEVFSLIRDNNHASMNVAIRMGMLVRGSFVKQYKGEDMTHLIFSARKNNK